MVDSTCTSRAEVISRLKELAQNPENIDRSETESLKQLFYKIQSAELAASREAFLKGGGNPEDFEVEPDGLENDFKATLAEVKEILRKKNEQMEQEKAANLVVKQAILDKLQALIEASDGSNESYQEVKKLQQTWKETGPVPDDKATEIWKNYQLYSEQYYDLLKMSFEAREYDFKKNLETKTALCEEAEKLLESEDIISAFRQMQAISSQFRECGPVAKELRDEIWARFKEVMTTIAKRYQSYFEEKKAKEEENLQKKTELCEKVEAINSLDRGSINWNEKTEEVLSIQKDWKLIGFAPQKSNQKIYDRFRAACNEFFEEKSKALSERKSAMEENLQKKKALLEEAMALKDSTEWKKTAEAISELQKKWKEIGPVARKESEAIWNQFHEACSYFFEQKHKADSGSRNQEKENLQKKRTIIDSIKALLEEKPEELQSRLKALQEEWNSTGHVPFREKDKLYEAYHSTVDAVYKVLNENNGKRRLNQFKDNLKARAQGASNDLQREKERLLRAFEQIRQQRQTFENNLGFLTSKSSKGNSLVNEMKRKMQGLENDMAIMSEKIKALEEQLRQQKENNSAE